MLDVICAIGTSEGRKRHFLTNWINYYHCCRWFSTTDTSTRTNGHQLLIYYCWCRYFSNCHLSKRETKTISPTLITMSARPESGRAFCATILYDNRRNKINKPGKLERNDQRKVMKQRIHAQATLNQHYWSGSKKKKKNGRHTQQTNNNYRMN